MKRIIIIGSCLLMIVGCASWQTMSTQEKQESLVTYYKTFSMGLKVVTILLPSDKQQIANAAINVADAAIDSLDESIRSDFSSTSISTRTVEAQAKVESANAVVGATQSTGV